MCWERVGKEEFESSDSTRRLGFIQPVTQFFFLITGYCGVGVSLQNPSPPTFQSQRFRFCKQVDESLRAAFFLLLSFSLVSPLALFSLRSIKFVVSLFIVSEKVWLRSFCDCFFFFFFFVRLYE